MVAVSSSRSCALRRSPRVGLRLLAAACIATILGAQSAAHAQLYTVTIQNSGMGRGHVKSFPAGMDCTVSDGPTYTGTCSIQKNAGTVVTLVAEADHPEVTFTGYSGAPCSGGGADCVLPALAQNYTVTVSFNPTRQYALTVTVDGNGYGTVTQTDTRGTPSILCNIQGTNQAKTCTANYWVTTVAKLAKVTPNGFVSSGAWSGACTSDPCSIVMDGARGVTATFSSPAVTVVSAGANGNGKVVGNGIDCTIGSTVATGTCFVTYASPSQQTVTLNAQASPGSRFSGWSVTGAAACPGTGSCVINGPALFRPGTVVSAAFAIDQKVVNVGGTGSGTVKSSGNEVDCTLTLSSPSGRCDIAFTPGAAVKLTAAPATGWQFTSWGGACAASTTVTCDLLMTADLQVTVTFTRTLTTLTIAGGGTGEGTVESTDAAKIINCAITGTNTSTTGCSAQVPFETNVTLTARPQANSTFESWSLASCTGTGPCVVPMTTSRTITATFKGTRAQVTVTGQGTGDGLVTSDGMSCRIAKGAVAVAAECLTTAPLGGTATLTAVPQNGSLFSGWSVASCPATSLTCAVPVSGPTSVSARFTAPPNAADLVSALLGSGPKLSADQERELDKFGNNDGTFNLGDLLAQLDRTRESVSPAILARIADADRTRSGLTSPRRGAP